jgi:DNA-binding transcriptional LysR family regulator
MSTMDQIKALKEGRIDVGFGRIRHEDPSVRRVVLREERMIGAAGRASADRRKAGAFAARPAQRHADHLSQAPRPSYADQVLAGSTIAARTDADLRARELQIALGLVAAGEGFRSCRQRLRPQARRRLLQGSRRQAARFAVIMSMRMLDESADIRRMLELIYVLYGEAKMEHVAPAAR